MMRWPRCTFKVIELLSRRENQLIDLSAEAKEFPLLIYVAWPNKGAGSHCFCIQLGVNKGISICSERPGSGTRVQKNTLRRSKVTPENLQAGFALRKEQDAIYRGSLFAAKIGNPLFKRVHFDTCTRLTAPEINCNACARFFARMAQKIGANTSCDNKLLGVRKRLW
jgi:hypothetical protein